MEPNRRNKFSLFGYCWGGQNSGITLVEALDATDIHSGCTRMENVVKAQGN